MSTRKKRNSQRRENDTSPVMPVTKAQAARINFFSDYTFDLMPDNEVEEFVLRNLIALPNRVVTRQMLKSWDADESTKDNSECLPPTSVPMRSSSSSLKKSKEVKFTPSSESHEKEVESPRTRNYPGEKLEKQEFVVKDPLAHTDVSGQDQKSLLFIVNSENMSKCVPQGNIPFRTRSKSDTRPKQAMVSAGGHENVFRSPPGRMIAGDISQNAQNDNRKKTPETTEDFRMQRFSEPEIQYSENQTKRYFFSRRYSHKNTEMRATEEIQSKKSVENKFGREPPHILRENEHEMKSKKSVGNECGREPHIMRDNGHEMKSKKNVGNEFGREPQNLSDNGHKMNAAKVKRGILTQNVAAHFPYGETIIGYWIRIVSQLLKLLSFAGIGRSE